MTDPEKEKIKEAITILMKELVPGPNTSYQGIEILCRLIEVPFSAQAVREHDAAYHERIERQFGYGSLQQKRRR